MQRSFGTEISGNRGRGCELSPLARAGIISQAEAGRTYKELAQDFGCSKRTVRRTINRWKNHNTVASLPRRGRPQKLNRAQKRAVIRLARTLPKIVYTDLQKETETEHVSRATFYRLLKKHGITKYRAKRRPKLNRKSARIRLNFCREHRNFNFRRRTVKFSDECSVQRGSDAQAEWVFRRPDQKWDYEMIQEKENNEGMSQMVWGCIWVTSNGRVGRSELIIMERDSQAARQGYTAQSYIDTLEKGLLPHYRPGQVFVQDNAPIHKAEVTREWLESHGIWTWDWPPYSPDLNPIEHLWWALKKMVHKMHPELTKMGSSEEDWEALRAALREAWRKLSNRLIRALIFSMPRRLAACRRARGWQTKY